MKIRSFVLIAVGCLVSVCGLGCSDASVARMNLERSEQNIFGVYKEWQKAKNMEESIEEGEDPVIAVCIEQNNHFNNRITKLQETLKSKEDAWKALDKWKSQSSRNHVILSFNESKFEDQPDYKNIVKNIEMYESWVTKNDEKIAEIRKQNTEKAAREQAEAEAAQYSTQQAQ